ncbi:three-helix bundle dimerization domain-containing protein [Amycolatopsis sp. RTGN1]|uniref:three-helix bundle dimerization domain-containing protein n=1 Tax=Amycolatopsis ponsaeliensis TaxID=2992142 RepID=UPI00254A56F7|nr:hypothetical protein [Amycolatopsis sp. RTGN1]
MSTPTLDTMASEQLDTQLTQLKDRLTHDFAGLAPARVHDLVNNGRTRFAEARIHAFVPILIERAVRTTLATSPAKRRRD